MQKSLLTENAMAAVGQHRPLRTGLVTARDIRKYCVAVDNRNPLHLDPAVARASGYADVVAPSLFPAVATRPVPFEEELQPDGQYGDLAPDGLGHLQSLLAGQEWEFIRPVVAGERVIEEIRIGNVEERQGKSGPLVFVLEESLLSTEAGEPLLRGRNQLILREPPARDDLAPMQATLSGSAGPATRWLEGRMIKRPSLVSLFMFAATIWATHRIHWDRDSAHAEGLAAPILPGWMMASYLAEFATAQAPAGLRLSALSLRYKAFGFPEDELACSRDGESARDGEPDGQMALKLTNQTGQDVMSGTARFT